MIDISIYIIKYFSLKITKKIGKMAKKQATLAEEITNCQNSDKKYKKTGGIGK